MARSSRRKRGRCGWPDQPRKGHQMDARSRRFGHPHRLPPGQRKQSGGALGRVHAPLHPRAAIRQRAAPYTPHTSYSGSGLRQSRLPAVPQATRHPSMHSPALTPGPMEAQARSSDLVPVRRVRASLDCGAHVRLAGQLPQDLPHAAGPGTIHHAPQDEVPRATASSHRGLCFVVSERPS